MLALIKSVNNAVNNFIWGVPAMILLMGVGLYLSAGTRFVQLRKFGPAMKATLGRIFKHDKAGKGALTSFQALCTALAATVGTSPQYMSYILNGTRSGEKYLPAIIATLALDPKKAERAIAA